MKWIREGQLITFASGEYDDYGIDELVKATRPFDIKALQKEWENEHTVPDGNWDIKLRDKNSKTFLQFVSDKGLVESLEYIEVNHGDRNWCVTVSYSDED